MIKQSIKERKRRVKRKLVAMCRKRDHNHLLNCQSAMTERYVRKWNRNEKNKQREMDIEQQNDKIITQNKNGAYQTSRSSLLAV